MQRREFITLIGGAASIWPLTARAASQLPVIGFLNGVSGGPSVSAAFSSGLAEQGYVEGRNVRIEHRSANGQYDRLPGLAAELVSLPVNVIVAGPMPSAKAAKAATSTIPIVFLIGIDPVKPVWSPASIRPAATSQAYVCGKHR